jgi:hypothetical protein
MSLYRKVSNIVANYVCGKKRRSKPVEFIHGEDEDIVFLLKLEYTHTVQ